MESLEQGTPSVTANYEGEAGGGGVGGRKGPEGEDARTAWESVRWHTDAASYSELKFRKISGPDDRRVSHDGWRRGRRMRSAQQNG